MLNAKIERRIQSSRRTTARGFAVERPSAVELTEQGAEMLTRGIRKSE